MYVRIRKESIEELFVKLTSYTEYKVFSHIIPLIGLGQALN